MMPRSSILPYTLLLEALMKKLSGLFCRIASSRLKVPSALISKSSRGLSTDVVTAT